MTSVDEVERFASVKYEPRLKNSKDLNVNNSGGENLNVTLNFLSMMWDYLIDILFCETQARLSARLPIVQG